MGHWKCQYFTSSNKWLIRSHVFSFFPDAEEGANVAYATDYYETGSVEAFGLIVALHSRDSPVNSPVPFSFLPFLPPSVRSRGDELAVEGRESAAMGHL